MALVVSGQVRHSQRQPSDVEAKLRTHFPSLANLSGYDFAVDRVDCRVQFTCNNSSTLDFNVIITNAAASSAAPAAVALLIRETNSLNLVLAKAMGGRFRKAQVEYCYLEDDPSRAKLLRWISDRPLWSAAAKFSYILVALLAILGYILIKGQLGQPPSGDRTYNIVSLVIGIALPALAIPLPFLFQHLSNRENGRWFFEG
ncbi:hypothetical protein [Actinomadura welshii]|uniref:hypothetical protein n=1 Tax=Actinomadura welshii TaxID=3103817 RepID=UPI0012692D1B|nr:hypothetical protein [Actinomadura madurae]